MAEVIDDTGADVADKGDKTGATDKGGDQADKGGADKDAQTDRSADNGAAWRKAIVDARAKGDEAAAAKLTKKLERFADPGAILDSWEAATAELSAQGRVKIPGKDATDEDRAAWSKALGRPEKADGYKIKLGEVMPDGLVLDDADKAILKSATEKLHAKGGEAASPAAVREFYRLYGEIKEDQIAQAVANAELLKTKTEKELKAEWKGEYAANIQFAEAGLLALFGRDGVAALKERRMADGGLLFNDKQFMVAMMTAGRALAQDPNFLAASQLTGTTQSLQERKNEIMAWRNGTREQQQKFNAAMMPNGEMDVINTKLAALKPKAA